MKTSLLVLLTIALCAIKATAQQPADSTHAWQSLWQENMMNFEDEDDNALSGENLELLQELAEHPIDLNRATRDDLERLPFLSAQQVMDFMEYRDRYGPLRSMGEIRLIRSMDYQQVALLPCFSYVGEVADTLRYPRLRTIARYGQHELIGSLSYPLYTRKGNRNGYLGYKTAHWLRYDFHYGKYVRLGLLGAQDAGEPFFSNRNRWGYDVYTYYFQIRQVGWLNQLVAGKFKLSTGMGLVLNNSFSLGKLTILQNLGRQSSVLRPHASRSEADYFQGAAATVQLAHPLQLTLFGSYRPIDGTLNADGSVATLITSGYHRTPTEMEKKYNTHQTAAGAHAEFQYKGLRLGLTGVYTHLDRKLSPDTKTLYRRHHARGNNFLNASADYRFVYRSLSFSGETALNRDGAVATVNALSLQPSEVWSLVALQRFYSYRYTTLHGHAFSEGGHVQNESGIYLGGTWQPLIRLQLKAYADFAYFPWARYRVSQSSSAQDFLMEANYEPADKWRVKGRYRLHLRKTDRTGSSPKVLRRNDDHRMRLSVTYADEQWRSTTQADYVRAVGDSISHGWMVSQQLAWQHKWWQLHLTAAYFNTQDYESRIYAYERQLPHNFAFPSYYGQGLHMSLVGRANVGQWIQLDAKATFTRYFDRSTIGSGLQQVDGSSLTHLSLQARWRF